MTYVPKNVIMNIMVEILFGLFLGFDRCTGFIGLHKLKAFINALGVPLGHRHNAREKW
jgi:hypothetical protein